MEISSRFVKVSGNFEVPNDLIIGRDYTLKLDGGITAQVDADENDGTISRQFKYRPSTGQIEAENGSSIPLKDRRGNSQKLRSMIMNVWGYNYDSVMNCLLANGDELRSWVEKHS